MSVSRAMKIQFFHKLYQYDRVLLTFFHPACLHQRPPASIIGNGGSIFLITVREEVGGSSWARQGMPAGIQFQDRAQILMLHAIFVDTTKEARARKVPPLVPPNQLPFYSDKLHASGFGQALTQDAAGGIQGMHGQKKACLNSGASVPPNLFGSEEIIRLLSYRDMVEYRM